MRWTSLPGALLLAGLAATAWGCAAQTRTMHMGVLPNAQPLVTLVVTEDRAVVREECRNIPSAGAILGCSMWRPMDDRNTVRLVKIVRFTDAIPSPLALEIDIHELCHAIAALQPIDDPCHTENNGVIRAAAQPARFR